MKAELLEYTHNPKHRSLYIPEMQRMVLFIDGNPEGLDFLRVVKRMESHELHKITLEQMRQNDTFLRAVELPPHLAEFLVAQEKIHRERVDDLIGGHKEMARGVWVPKTDKMLERLGDKSPWLDRKARKLSREVHALMFADS